MENAELEQIAVNDSGTEASADTQLTQPRSANVHGWTYFIRHGDLIKIGFSIRPERRIAQIASTDKLPNLATLAIVPADIAGEYETHQRFAHLREHGEWFRAEPDLLGFIAGMREFNRKPAGIITRPRRTASMLPPAWANMPPDVRKVLAALHSIRIKAAGKPEIINRVSIAMSALEVLQGPEGREGHHACCRRDLNKAMAGLTPLLAA